MLARDIVDRFKNSVRLALGQEFVALYWFGSSAAGEGGADSDIDLLLETRSPLSPHDRDQVADIAVDLCADSGVLLDIHYYTSEEMTGYPYSNSPFLEAVVREGVRA